MAEFEIFLLAVSLAMDAFAVSICKGLKTKKVKLNHMALSGLWFGGFQALMPLLGYYFGQAFQKYIVAFDHWVTFGFMGNIDIFKAIAIIGITTFVIAMIGTKIGCICGDKLKSQAELLGGLILIGLGVKILVEHLYI
ncbi:MAG: manganese efflux pump [Erysipelotrichaceae bacterium]|nr:manganese efflux pump [Erysipelotrichaceae bacterium]